MFMYNGEAYYYANGKWLNNESKIVDKEIAAILDKLYSKDEIEQEMNARKKQQRKSATNLGAGHYVYSKKIANNSMNLNDDTYKTVKINSSDNNLNDESSKLYEMVMGMSKEEIDSCKMYQAIYNNPKAYTPWTKEEEEKLLFEISQGMKISKIAKIHERTSGAIRARLKHIDERNHI